MVTVTVVILDDIYCHSPLPSAGDSYRINIKNIITTGQENNSHKINKDITSSDPQVQLLHHHKHMTYINFKV